MNTDENELEEPATLVIEFSDGTSARWGMTDAEAERFANQLGSPDTLT